MLDLNRLRILRAVVASGSVTDTARQLGYTPSTISQHVHTLEREVGFSVVERSGRGIVPTAAGIALAEASGEVLVALSHLDATARDLRGQTSGRLSIRTFASAAYTWMPGIARALRREFPGLTLELSLDMDAPDDFVGDIEVLSEVPFDAPTVVPGYTRRELGSDDFLLAVPPEHPAAARGTAPLADFAGEDWVQYDFRDKLSARIVGQACAAAGFTPRYVARSQDHVTGLALVAAGVGVAIVPRLALDWSHFEVASVRVTNPVPQRRIVVLWRTGVRANPAAQRTLALLAGLAATLDAPGSGAARSR
ncbi:LysR family transcriptional regulator [Propionicicella superfundia]|uniref:LysR family transcriptional regulator n=1 Tax=Propionicicella superfundia TaxID=348582 RepID=UPI0003FACF7C|nr:LysR family transcriptional regulator [Propionicicella superfundia]